MRMEAHRLGAEAAAEEPDLLACRACPRLVAYREACRLNVPRRFQQEVRERGFWAKPVPGFGDPQAFLAIVGLAPAAFGANRTGRLFTGDRSGDFLFAALARAGLANRGESRHRHDGLELAGVFITAALRCAPPQNRPKAQELARCRRYLLRDLQRLAHLRVVLALGHIAHDAALRCLAPNLRPKPPFAHGQALALPSGLWLVDCYHVSQQNTFTGRLTAHQLDTILQRCLQLAGKGGQGRGSG